MDMAPGVAEILNYSLLRPNNITYPLPEFLIGGTHRHIVNININLLLHYMIISLKTGSKPLSIGLDFFEKKI